MKPHRSDRSVRLDVGTDTFWAIRSALWTCFCKLRHRVNDGETLLPYELRELRRRAYAYGELRRAAMRQRGKKVPRRTRALDQEGHYRPIARFPLVGPCGSCGQEQYGPMHDIAEDGPNLVHVCRKTARVGP